MTIATLTIPELWKQSSKVRAGFSATMGRKILALEPYYREFTTPISSIIGETSVTVGEFQQSNDSYLVADRLALLTAQGVGETPESALSQWMESFVCAFESALFRLAQADAWNSDRWWPRVGFQPVKPMIRTSVTGKLVSASGRGVLWLDRTEPESLANVRGDLSGLDHITEGDWFSRPGTTPSSPTAFSSAISARKKTGSIQTA